MYKNEFIYITDLSLFLGGWKFGKGGSKFLNPLGCYGPVVFKIKQNLIQEIGQSCDNKGHLFNMMSN